MIATAIRINVNFLFDPKIIGKGPIKIIPADRNDFSDLFISFISNGKSLIFDLNGKLIE